MDAGTLLIGLAIVAVIVYILGQRGRGETEERPSNSGSREPIRDFHTKVVGVTRNNGDGTSRQLIIAKCDISEDLALVHEPDNPHDKNAVAVVRRATGEQLGFLASDIASDIVRNAAVGNDFSCEISDLTGGTREKPNRGVNIRIGIYK